MMHAKKRPTVPDSLFIWGAVGFIQNKDGLELVRGGLESRFDLKCQAKSRQYRLVIKNCLKVA